MKNSSMHDSQLIFMISLPRSGSTMLQRILGAHPDVYTRSEPWLMLPPLSALTEEDTDTRYDSTLAYRGIHDFIDNLPGNGESFYYEQIRSCYLALYNRYLQENSRSFFLDKTPRYYQIYDELKKVFPNAKFIILYRHPVAVLASILRTWVNTKKSTLAKYRTDLTEGIDFLCRDFSDHLNTHSMKYEDLLTNPQLETQRLFNFLGISYSDDYINYGKHLQDKWLFGDQGTVYEKTNPDQSHIDNWEELLSDAQYCQTLGEYLALIGEESFSKLGYSYKDTKSTLLLAKEKFDHTLAQPMQLDDIWATLEERYTQSNKIARRRRKEIIALETRYAALEKRYAELNSKSRRYRDLLNERTDELEKIQPILRAAEEFSITPSVKPLEKARKYKQLQHAISHLSLRDKDSD